MPLKGAVKLMTLNPSIEDLLLRLAPSETAFLSWLCPHIDDSLLTEIAAADGGFDEEANFQALKQIQDGHKLPVPLPWIPKEVLQLMCWSEPALSLSIRQQREGHLIRAFCCAVLLQAANEPETRDHLGSENSVLIQMVASALYLGKDASKSAMRLLCWRAMLLPRDYDEYPFFVLALLLLYAAVFEQHQDGESLSLLADWGMAEELRARMQSGAVPKSEAWLLGLTYHDSYHHAWKRLTQQILLDPTKSFPEPTATKLREIAGRLVSAQD